jgi:hypothetical protein
MPVMHYQMAPVAYSTLARSSLNFSCGQSKSAHTVTTQSRSNSARHYGAAPVRLTWAESRETAKFSAIFDRFLTSAALFCRSRRSFPAGRFYAFSAALTALVP